MNTLELNIQGMHCGACVTHVTKALMSVAGVAEVDVDLANGRARVQGDLRAGGEPLIAALAARDYPATVASDADQAAPVVAMGYGNGKLAGNKTGGCCG